MSDNHHFIVLKDCRFLLHSLSLTNGSNSFRFFSTIAIIIFYFVLFTPITILFITFVWFAYDQNFDLDNIVWVLNLCVAIIQIELIFVCFVVNKKLLTETMTQLQLLVNQRMLIFLDDK